MPTLQEDLLNQIRQRSDLSLEEREERIQRLRVIWHSQLGQKPAEKWHKQNVAIEKVLEQLEIKLPVAVLLGAPGSGKSTVMRWLALHMARAFLSSRYSLPDDLYHRQIPILLRISDYAKRLNSENISFDQFFNEFFAKFHQELPTRILEELQKGNCLMLFDGLDEVATYSGPQCQDSLRPKIR